MCLVVHGLVEKQVQVVLYHALCVVIAVVMLEPRVRSLSSPDPSILPAWLSQILKERTTE